MQNQVQTNLLNSLDWMIHLIHFTFFCFSKFKPISSWSIIYPEVDTSFESWSSFSRTRIYLACEMLHWKITFLNISWLKTFNHGPYIIQWPPTWNNWNINIIDSSLQVCSYKIWRSKTCNEKRLKKIWRGESYQPAWYSD